MEDDADGDPTRHAADALSDLHAPGGAGKKGLSKTQIQQKDVDRIK